MKILMITPYVPYPPSSGGQIRTFNLLKYLSKTNQITLVCLYKFNQEKQHLKILRPFCHQIFFCKRPATPWSFKTIINSVFSLNPFLIVRNFSNQAKEILHQILIKEKFDVIHAETFYVMPHLPQVNIPTLLVEQTIEYKVYQHFIHSLPFFIQPFFYLDILKLKFWERYYWRKATQVATVSDSDKKLIKTLEKKIKPVVIPNCAGDEMIVKKLSLKKTTPSVLFFQGNFLWLQNTEAANVLVKKILPLLKKTIKDFKLIIAGQYAETKLANLSDRCLKIIDIPIDDNKTVRKLYKKATVFIAPIYGPGGTRLKILAAMANGLPVIATKTGISGLEVKDNNTVLIANSINDFVKKIKLILNDQALYQRIRSNAHQLIIKKYNWKNVSKNLELVYQKLIKKW